MHSFVFTAHTLSLSFCEFYLFIVKYAAVHVLTLNLFLLLSLVVVVFCFCFCFCRWYKLNLLFPPFIPSPLSPPIRKVVRARANEVFTSVPRNDPFFNLMEVEPEGIEDRVGKATKCMSCMTHTRVCAMYNYVNLFSLFILF